MFKAEHLDLDRNTKASAAFREIAASCFRQFRLNEEILRQRRNSEALHQARVALRRLRSAFSLFRPLLMGDEPKRIQEELRWLAGVLGEARNLDVLLMKAKDSDLRAKLKDARNKAYGDAVEERGQFEAGEFATTSEAMRDAVRVWQRQRLEDAKRLNAMRARIRRSLDDPRPSLTAEEAEAEMDRFMKGQEKASRNAAR
nr:CHAD domain-containing protein [Rhizobium ruizarguesonis]